jgi:WD40 repeat protein
MHPVKWLQQREHSTASSKAFTHGSSCALRTVPFRSQTLLKGHTGCVNALAISAGAGDLLASGGDDTSVVIWHMNTISESPVAHKYYPGHLANIFSLACE